MVWERCFSSRKFGWMWRLHKVHREYQVGDFACRMTSASFLVYRSSLRPMLGNQVSILNATREALHSSPSLFVSARPLCQASEGRSSRCKA
jgi:hypothetical protein